MAKKKKTPVGQQTRPGEEVQPPKGKVSKASRPTPGSTMPKGYTGPGGQVKGGKPTVGAKKTEGGKTRPPSDGGIMAGLKGVSGSGRYGGTYPSSPQSQTPAAAPSPTGGLYGMTVTGGGIVGNDPGVNPARAEIERRAQMAGLPASMVDQIMNAWGYTIDADSTIEDYIALGVENAEFKARYPSIVNQWKRLQAGEMGVQLMSPVEVLAFEKQVRNAADDYGLSAWVSSPEQIAKLIDGEVTADEAIERINAAGYAAVVAPKEFREAFFKHYGLTEGNLVGYFLDPDKEEAEIKKAVAQGSIVASAMQHGFANDWKIGQRLADKGIDAGSSMSGFARAALNRGLGAGLGQKVSDDTVIDAEFGDATAARDVASVTAQRVGRFNTSGGAAESQKGISGLGQASAE